MPTETARRGYFDPLVLAKIATMSLRARHVVEGLLSGLHDSPYRGYSVEFAEHREYVPGDEIRHIDWKAYGKFDRYFIKEYEEETNLRAYLLVDASASMDYGSEGLSKFDYSCYLAASLAYLMLRQGDNVGLVTFGAQVQRYIPPRNGVQHMHALASHLEATRPQGETHLDQVLRELAGKLVLSDPRAIRAAYLQQMELFIAEYRRACRRETIDYSLFPTTTPLDVALTRYLARRQ